MDKAALIDKLNEAISLELAGLLQYNQYSQVLLGTDRRIWEDFFKEASDESLSHARTFAERVVALGGTPSCEPEPVKQAEDVTEMLQNSLALEKRAVQIYNEALEIAGDNAGYRNLLEDQIDAETQDVEELEKYLNQVEKVSSKQRKGKASSA